jgi:LmbE family N-acetylglucosaminyl deacetylase
MMRVLRTIALALTIGAPRLLSAQERGATALGEAVAGLDVTTRVLLIGAHPDDEDTQLLTWLARGRQVETAYLSLTRGDGGQNLIGNELGPVLGMIRTEELLAARRLDGGRQFFTRAYDFGFSKTAEETYTHWPKDSLLRDVVTVVRAFRPQIIVAVFSGTPRDGHGHHQVSGQLAREAFDAAMDTAAWPRARTNGLPAWRPLKFYRAARFIPSEATVHFNVGELSPLRGQTYAELASLSRSQHLSQGFGALQRRGATLDYLKLEASRVGAPSAPETSLLDSVDAGWGRFAALPVTGVARAALDSLPAAITAVRAVENLTAPAPMVAPLARVLMLIDAARSAACAPSAGTQCVAQLGDLGLSLETARRRATTALLTAAGVSVEATAPRELVAVGDTLPVTVTVYNQGAAAVRYLGAAAALRAGGAGPSATGPGALAADSSAGVTLRAVPVSAVYPWWLSAGRQGDVFTLPLGNGFIGTSEERILDSHAWAELTIDGAPVTADAGEIVRRFADPARGELRRPIGSVPAISVLLDDEVEYARAGVPLDRTIDVHVRSASSSPRGVTLQLELPDGLRADSATRRAALDPFAETTVRFRVRGTLPAGRHHVSVKASSGGETYTMGWVPIEYAHIRPMRYYRPALLQVEAVPAALPPNPRVAYVRGVGDNVAPMLSQLGLAVTMIAPETLATADLSRFGAVVVGPRAFAATPALVASAPRLQDYARAGGTVVVQYGQNEIQTPGILPYPVTLARTAARVTDEMAPVRVLDPGARLLASPNQIGQSDFEHWVQERALYMPSTIDPHYRTVLEMHDPGEPPNQGAVLVAPLGKGAYVYTSLALFRQLPAGVPGAARIFLNLLAANGRTTASAAANP